MAKKRFSKETLLSLWLFLVMGIYLFFLAAFLFKSRLGIRVWNLFPLRSVLEYLIGLDYVTGFRQEMLRNFAWSNLLGNVVIFIPLGVYMALFRKNGPLWKTVLIVAAVSMAAEVLQVATKTGIGDIDDLLLNTLGGLLGALIYRGLCRICGGPTKAKTLVTLWAPVAGIVCFGLLILWSLIS
ncbi:MAG: VanZ family protein [Acutalibacter sp.]|jgi:glycopeptide antibiotics resistance protein